MISKQKKEAIDILNKLDIAICPENLLYYVQQGHLENVKLLVIAGVDANTYYFTQESTLSKTYWWPLYVAIENNYFEIAEFLIKNGADVNFNSPERIIPNPMIHAIDKKNLELVKLLINNGLKLDLIPNGRLPFIFEAIQSEQLEILKLLIANGVDVNKPKKDGWSPLAVAYNMRNEDIILALINAKAKPLTEKELKTIVALNAKTRFGGIIDVYRKNKIVKIGFWLVIVFALLFLIGKGCSAMFSLGVDVDNPKEVKEYLIKNSYKAKEDKVEIVLEFYESGGGSLEAYLNGKPTGSRQSFNYEIGTPTDDGGVNIETTIGNMSLERNGSISMYYNGEWYFFREWSY